MADDKTKKGAGAPGGTATAQPSPQTAPAFDYNAYFKQHGLGYTADDMRDMTSLIPIYSFEEAWELKWPPVCGKLIARNIILVDKTEEDPEKANRPFYLVEAKVPTKALKGTGDNRVPVDIKVGELVYWPESGSLKNRDRLIMASNDPETMFDVLFRLEGPQLEPEKKGRNGRWPIDAQLLGKGYARDARYKVSSTPRVLTGAAPAQLPTGEVVNAQGQPAGNMFARPAS